MMSKKCNTEKMFFCVPGYPPRSRSSVLESPFSFQDRPHSHALRVQRESGRHSSDTALHNVPGCDGAPGLCQWSVLLFRYLVSLVEDN